jgi:uncharacterized protein (DUF924 family)
MADDILSSVLSFWFGELDSEGRASQETTARWWKKDETFDQEIRERFGTLHSELVRAVYGDWLATPRGRLAAVIVLDQFSRNLFRGSARSFAGDAQALEIATQGIVQGSDRALAFDERACFYMPFVHSEKLDDQERGIELFTAFRNELEGAKRERIDDYIQSAERHRDIVKRFGRFPHRNGLLGRASTPEETEFLKQPGSSF